MATQTLAADPASSKMQSRSLGIVFFVMLIDVIGISIFFPVAPFIIQRYSNNASMVTMLTVIYAAAQFFAAPLLGKLSDRYGRRPILIASIIGSAIGYVIFGIGGALWILFLSRLIDGFTGGNMSTAAAVIADLSAPEERAKNFGLIGMAFGLGFILGPALGGALSAISLDAPAFGVAALALISVALIYFLLPETLPADKRERNPLRIGDLNPFASIAAIARKPGMSLLLLVNCLFAFAFDGINSIAGLFAAQKFTVQPWQIAIFFVLIGVTIAGMQGAVIPKVVKHGSEKRFVLISLIGQAGGNLLIMLAPTLLWFVPAGIFVSAMSSFIWGALGALIANRVRAEEQGTLAGVTSALASLMTVLGPLGAGIVYDQVMPSAPYWMGAGVLLLAAFVTTTKFTE